MLLKILTAIFTQPYQLHFFCYDYSPHLHEQGLFDPEQTVTQHNQALATWLESREAWRDKFIATLKRVFALTWPLAPTNQAEWREQVHAVLTAMTGQLGKGAKERLDNELLLAGVLWPLRKVEDTQVIASLGLPTDKKFSRWFFDLSDVWPITPFELAERLRVKPEGLHSRESKPLGLTEMITPDYRAMFIDALATRLSQSHVNDAYHLEVLVKQVKPQIEAIWGQEDMTGLLDKLTWPEPPRAEVVPTVKVARIDDDLFLGREWEQAKFREVLQGLGQAQGKPKAMPVVFLFYGQGGMGKTYLTKRLEDITETEFAGQFEVKRLDWQPLAEAGRLPRDGAAYLLAEMALEQLAEQCLTGEALVDYQATVARYRALYDKLEQALQQLLPDSRFAALRDFTPRELADVWLKPRDSQYSLVKAFLEKQLSQEVVYFANPWPKWGEKIGQGLRQASQQLPLVFIWDTYELVDRADKWLRSVLLSSGGRVVWVIAGRNNLTHGHEADRTLSGYADGAWAALYHYDMQALAVAEILAYFNDRILRVSVPPPPLTEAEAQAIEQAVGGMPLLIKLVADEWVRRVPLAAMIEGLPRPDRLMRSNEAASPLIAEIFRRVLRQVEPESAEETAFFFLAMQPRPLAFVQQAMLTHQPTFYETTNQLTQRFSTIRRTPEGLVRLHDIAYHYIRAYLMQEQAHLPLIRQIAQHAAQLCHDRRAELVQQAGLTTLEQRVKHKEWRAMTQDLIYWLFWGDETQAWQEFTPRLVEGMGFDSRWWVAPSFPLNLITIVQQCPALHGDTTQRYLSRLSFEADKREILLTMLEQWQKSGWLTDDDPDATQQRDLIFLILQGEGLTVQKRYDEAWAKFLEVEKLLSVDAEGLKKRLSGGCEDLSSKLLWPNGAGGSKPSQWGCEVAQKAVELNPQNERAWYNLGVALDDLGQYEKAIDAYQAAIKLDPKYAYPYNGLGIVYRELKEYEQAIRAYQAVIRLDSKYANPHNGLGNVYYSLKEYEQAIESYQAAISLDPKAGYFHNNLGQVYRELKQYDQAIASYQQAISLEPTAGRYNTLGNVYYYKKDYEQAITTYQIAIGLDPQEAIYHSNLAITYCELKEYEQAIASYQQAISLEPTASRYDTLGDVYREVKEYDKAIEAYQQAISLEPTANRYDTLGDIYCIYCDKKEYNQAIELYHQAIRLDPENGWRYRSLANIYAMTKQWEQALTIWLKALKLESSNGNWHGCVADCFNHLNRPEEATPYLARARELMVNESSYGKACIEAIAGEVDAALDYLRQAKAEGSLNVDWAKADPDLETLRGDKRFWEIVGE